MIVVFWGTGMRRWVVSDDDDHEEICNNELNLKTTFRFFMVFILVFNQAPLPPALYYTILLWAVSFRTA